MTIDFRKTLLDSGMSEAQLEAALDVGFHIAFRTRMSRLYECQGCYGTTTSRENHFGVCEKVQLTVVQGLLFGKRSP